jgi:signal transduction histidine kinase
MKMNFPFLKHPKSAQSLHPSNNHILKAWTNSEREVEHLEDEFLSIASHELRTPLTAIKGNTSLIKQYFWDQIPGGELRGIINDIDDASDKMLSLVNNFLDTLRLEQKLIKFKSESFDLVELAKTIAVSYQNNNLKREVEIVVKEPNTPLGKVAADKEWTRKLLGYILDNAIKYTDRGTVTIYFTQEVQSVIVQVSDTGRGIALQAQKSLFKKFAQTNENILTRETVQGTGLGLYLAKLVAGQMKGDVHLESSELGRGSTFSISIPVAR